MTWPARHVHLVRQLTRREIAARYRGSVLGVLWSLVTPLLTLALYTFLFGVVFRTRWNVNAPEGRVEFALILFVGLIVHGLLAECLGRAPSLILQHANLVKRVVFPLELLAWSLVGSALFNALVALIAWAFAAVGGFEPADRVGCVDVDYCLRAQAIGQRTVLTPHARLRHSSRCRRSQMRNSVESFAIGGARDCRSIRSTTAIFARTPPGSSWV